MLSAYAGLAAGIGGGKATQDPADVPPQDLSVDDRVQVDAEQVCLSPLRPVLVFMQINKKINVPQTYSRVYTHELFLAHIARHSGHR